jgi:large subunit ribosomal protein L10
MAHVATWKKEKVQELTDAMISNKVIAIVDVHGIPSAQLQMMRQGLRSKATIMMTRNNLLDIAIEQAAKERPGLEQLLKSVSSQCAVVTTNVNPFRLFREMEATKSAAPAKPGDIAPEDIVIKQGDTPFKPGPIVGELQKAGIPAGIEGGKIVIKKEKILVRQGEVISEVIAKILPKLEIMPMTVGLDLKAAFEDGILYGRDVLNIPPNYYNSMLSIGARNAMGLSMEIAYVAPETIVPLLAKAYREAMAVSMEAVIPTKDNIGMLLAKADAGMLAISALTGMDDERIKKRK